MQQWDDKKQGTRPARLVVRLAEQSLTVADSTGVVLREFEISSSRYGVGFRPGSFQTPTGRFRIAARIGDGEPPGMVFKSRIAQGWQGSSEDPADLVQTRILWLEGCDPENANTRERYIYIHGTNHEESIGEPASIGCIRLRNSEMIELFDLCPEGMELWIV